MLPGESNGLEVFYDPWLCIPTWIPTIRSRKGTVYIVDLTPRKFVEAQGRGPVCTKFLRQKVGGSVAQLSTAFLTRLKDSARQAAAYASPAEIYRDKAVDMQ